MPGLISSPGMHLILGQGVQMTQNRSEKIDDERSAGVTTVSLLTLLSGKSDGGCLMLGTALNRFSRKNVSINLKSFLANMLLKIGKTRFFFAIFSQHNSAKSRIESQVTVRPVSCFVRFLGQ
jgi:hypothetical protein